MSKKRRRFNAEFKFRVALEVAKGQQTIGELASKHNLHSNQISQWKRQLLEEGAEVFTGNGKSEQQALHQAKPEIFNPDQGAQFTAHDFTGCLEQAQVRISMDGRGRALDNIFIERL